VISKSCELNENRPITEEKKKKTQQKQGIHEKNNNKIL